LLVTGHIACVPISDVLAGRNLYSPVFEQEVTMIVTDNNNDTAKINRFT